ncbi:MAG: glycosyltransferase family 39 protein [Caldilineaceae bacterium]
MRFGLLAILLLSFALNLTLLDRFPLREDEALYSYWALHFLDSDPLMLTVWPDKPPLYWWAQAGSFHLLGTTQAAARILNILLTTATVALVAASSKRLYGNGSALVAAILCALNPFLISFAATAYTDPMLVFWGQLALYFGLCNRSIMAGLALGAALMTKQQGVLYIPLIAGVTLLNHNQPFIFTTRRKTRALGYLLGGLGLVIGPMLYWDSLRWRVAPSPWELSLQNYGALTLSAPNQWLGRLSGWLDLLWYFGGNWWSWLACAWLVTVTLLTIRLQTQRRLTILLWLWTLGFLAIHLCSTIQIWDRYLLPLVPIGATLLGGGLGVVADPLPPTSSAPSAFYVQNRHRLTRLLAIGLCVTLLPTAIEAAGGALPIGGDHGAYSGLVEAVDWVEKQEKPAILYQQRLGWQLQFYLYTAHQHGQVEARWFANATTLADNAAKNTARPRYYLQPTWSPVADLAPFLAMRNLTLIPAVRFGNMELSIIREKVRPVCDWCLCQLQPASESTREQRVHWPIFNNMARLPAENFSSVEKVSSE